MKLYKCLECFYNYFIRFLCYIDCAYISATLNIYVISLVQRFE